MLSLVFDGLEMDFVVIYTPIHQYINLLSSNIILLFIYTFTA
jgi:hypothetical protein